MQSRWTCEQSQFVGFSFYITRGRHVHQIKKNGDLVGGIAMPERLNKHSPNLLQVWRDFYCLQIAISIYIYHIGDGGQPVKKILVSARGLSTQEVEVKSLHIRTKISINREGVTAFAVFLLSFFVRTRRKAVSGIGCRSPPVNLDFQKNSDWLEEITMLEKHPNRKKDKYNPYTLTITEGHYYLSFKDEYSRKLTTLENVVVPKRFIFSLPPLFSGFLTYFHQEIF